jgi:integrase
LGLSAIDKREIWSQWKAGQTLHEIGRAYGKCHNTIRAVLLPRGGIPPLARRRSRLALTFNEREDISRGMASGSSIREIASCLHRAASTVSREVARHGGRPAYRAYDADQQAWNAALRPKRCLLAVNSELRDVVASKLILDWSPEQISGWLKAQYPHMSTIKYWKQDELLAVLAAAKRESVRDHAMILFAYTFGLRANELATLTVQNVQTGRLSARPRRTRCPWMP